MFIYLKTVKKITIIKNDKLVRNNLYIRFKNNFFYRQNSGSSPVLKHLIKHGENIEKREQTLLKRWEKLPSAVLVTIKNNQYAMDDVRRRRDPIEFALAIIKTVRTTNISVYNQIILIYTDIKLKFRRDLSKPVEKITMDVYFQK